jgi:hypothetical protein
MKQTHRERYTQHERGIGNNCICSEINRQREIKSKRNGVKGRKRHKSEREGGIQMLKQIR